LEPLIELGLDACRGRLIGRAEPNALDDPAGHRDDRRGNDAGADDAQNEGHRSSQDTIRISGVQLAPRTMLAKGSATKSRKHENQKKVSCFRVFAADRCASAEPTPL